MSGINKQDYNWRRYRDEGNVTYVSRNKQYDRPDWERISIKRKAIRFTVFRVKESMNECRLNISKRKKPFVVRHNECLLLFGRINYISTVIFLLEMDHFNS